MFNFCVVMGKMLFFTNIAMNKAYNVRGFYRKNICLIIPYSKIDSRLRPSPATYTDSDYCHLTCWQCKVNDLGRTT